MYLADPDFPNNRSNVYITFEQALDIIRAVDCLTQGIRKIIYLVGWQGLGHDDCYPEMDVINEALKRPCDKSAADSLNWLFEEAEKYNTVVSFHGNIADAYAATPCFGELAEANALVNGLDGRPAVIEHFNDRDAYKTSYKQFWESGVFCRIWDRFCEATPVKKAGTVHLDNFCIAESLNPVTYVEEEDEGRKNILDYISSTGIDVTSEYTYREAHFRNESPEHPIRKLYETAGEDMNEVPWETVPMRTLGRIPATWWTSNMTAEECMDFPPSLYSGHLTDEKLLKVFYGAMHGEDIWQKYGPSVENWADEFLYQFCTLQLPYFYLNRYNRLELKKNGDGYTVAFSDGVVSNGPKSEISKSGLCLKSGDDLILPLDDSNTVFIAYSKNGKNGFMNIPDADFDKAFVSQITVNGNIPLGDVEITQGKISLDIQPGQALVIRKAVR